jgi:hypothetical protein
MIVLSIAPYIALKIMVWSAAKIHNTWLHE